MSRPTRVIIAVALACLAIIGLDVVDSARRVVVLGGYAWFALLSGAALTVAVSAFRGPRSPHE